MSTRALLASCIALFALMVGTQVAAQTPGRSVQELLTPERAVELALSKPLVFSERFSGEDVGLFDQICLFHNDKVLVRVDYCGPAGTGERRGHEVIGLNVFTPDGQHVRIYAEVRAPAKIASAQRDQYIMWRNEYHDFGTLKPLKLSATSQDLKAFHDAKKKLRWGTYPACFLNGEEFVCRGTSAPASTVLTKAGLAFSKAPPATWFKLVKTVDGLITKHGGRRQD